MKDIFYAAFLSDLPADASSNRIISKQSIGEYFMSVKEKYRMLTPVNIKDYTQNMFYKYKLKIYSKGHNLKKVVTFL